MVLGVGDLQAEHMNVCRPEFRDDRVGRETALREEAQKRVL